MEDGSAAIQVHQLHKEFGSVKALQGVTLDIAAGQVFGLLGPNGAGKTTLIRALIGSTRPTAGRLTVLGFDPTRDRRPLRARIGYMPQYPALYDDISVRENIRFFCKAHPVADVDRRVQEVLDFVGLVGRARDPVFKLSGGMRQRVSLACALVHQPQLLLLDEPTSGIDPQLRETFWQHFRHLTGRGVTIIVSTHQMDEAMYCDRLAILHQGHLLADESPRRLLWDSQARITLWRGTEAESHTMSDYPHQLPLLLRDSGLDPAVSRIEVEEDTLETIVLRLINNRRDAPPESDPAAGEPQ